MSGGGGGGLECCPLVVDPLTFFALIGFIGAATAFLNTVITMNIMMRKRRSIRVPITKVIGVNAQTSWSKMIEDGRSTGLWKYCLCCGPCTDVQ